MALANREAASAPTIHGAPCSVGKYYRDNVGNEAELQAINEHLYEYGYDAGQLMAIFTEENIAIRRNSINKHRGQNCRCFTIDKDICCPGCRYDLAHCVCGKKAAA
jgi:hypothetical protein